MIIECCSQERSYTQFYGLIAERFCKLNRIWTDASQEAFANYYDTIHRYETNRLRNIARLFGHLIASDAISWAVLHAIHMNEEETTSSSRIFVKIMMQEVMEEVGLKKMAARLKEPDLQQALTGIFPTDNPKNTRFAINYFTSIGLGLITEDMRTWLQVSLKQLTDIGETLLTETLIPICRTHPSSSWHSVRLPSKRNLPIAILPATAPRTAILPPTPAIPILTLILPTLAPDLDSHRDEDVRPRPDAATAEVTAACLDRLPVEDVTRMTDLPLLLRGLEETTDLPLVDGMNPEVHPGGGTTMNAVTSEMPARDGMTAGRHLLGVGMMRTRLLLGEGRQSGMIETAEMSASSKRMERTEAVTGTVGDSLGEFSSWVTEKRVERQNSVYDWHMYSVMIMMAWQSAYRIKSRNRVSTHCPVTSLLDPFHSS